MIEYVKGNILNEWHNDQTIIVHACNSQGVWGSGFAKQLALKSPAAEGMYQRHCMTRKNEGYDVTGKSFLIGLPYLHVRIGCLFTSEFYGNRKSAADVVLRNTATSIRDLFKVIPEKSFEKIISQNSE